ncbi:MAG: alpha-L-fucosidase, partial [Clostridia bacterium]|nr:alpha-L-fucosidase [Clostridia bacterium]
GFYLSPWDRNSKLYGTDAYNDYYKKQLTELLTEYGEIFYVWFDGACGEGPNGKKQEYDFPGYIELIRKYQPNACIFNDGGPDIRWIGNESGKARYAEWCVLPIELIHRCEMQKELTPEGNLEDIYNTWQDLGSDAILRHSRGLSFCPAETDMSIRNGWFYHPEEAPHSLERLLNTYYTSVGGNASFNLNIPPMPNGKFDPRDVKRLKEMGDALRSAFEKDITNEAVIEKIESSSSQAQYRAAFNEKKDVRMVVLKENISCGQRVERFQLLKKDDFGKKKCFYEGTTIGFQKICPVREEGITEFFIKILSSRDEADVDIRIFG